MSDDSRIDSLRNAFFTGLLLLAPLAITWWVFAWLFESIGGAVKPLAFDLLSVPDELRNHRWLQIVWNILATLLVVALITGLGWLSRYILGRFFGNLAERFFLTIPGFKPHNEYYLDRDIRDQAQGAAPFNENLLGIKNYDRIEDLL